MIILFIGLVGAYLIGSIPTAYIFGRMLKGVDIREYGSGNVGATNVFRVVGKVPGLIALALDIFKGFLCATYLASFFMYFSPVVRPELYRIFAGLAAIAGHNWTIFLNFKGGKGVAASAGVVIGLIPKIFCLGFLVWGIAFSLTGFVSVASIIASISIPIFALVFGEATEIVIFMSLLCLLITYKHRPNITRLIKGEEKRISLFKKSK
ncbi:glycerol-3-phosphate 1-O-acyltransferase PlsY [Candidatus Omnitrophota bacterium]